MQKSTDHSGVRDGRHSFLYWLVIPAVLTWFAAGYLWGSFTDKPLWLTADPDTGSESGISPQLVPFSPLPPGDSGYLTLWFDDAWLSQYQIAFPLLQKFNFPGVIAVPASAVEQPDYVNWAQLQIMQKSGWEITNHSLSHNCQMHTWDTGPVIHEYQTSKLTLWKHQLASDILVTPCGVDSPVMRAEAAKVFIAYRTVNPGQNDLKKLDLFDLRVRNIDSDTSLEQVRDWIDQANQPDQWGILVFHLLGKNTGSKDADQYNLEPEKLTAILDYIKSKSVPVVVPSQIISAFAR